jgi:hypothetical protein
VVAKLDDVVVLFQHLGYLHLYRSAQLLPLEGHKAKTLL